MKGVVFNLLNEMVEEQFGLAMWDDLLDVTGLDGIYVSSETYPDEDLLALVAAAETATKIPAQDLVRAFGAYMLPKFAETYPIFFTGQTDLKSFLLTIDEVVHVEVRKLYPEAGLPRFTYESGDAAELTMRYVSPRRLCMLTEGLIQGSAEHFNETYVLDHETCMHTGADHCELKLSFGR